MPPSAALGAWSNFYVVLGSASAGLTGLMFVVITLVAGRSNTSRDGISTFSTPTVVHFCTALLVSAVLVAPWQSLQQVAFAVGAIGMYGVSYVFKVIRHARRLASYDPDLDDWIWHVALPFAGYVGLVGAAVALTMVAVNALFIVASAVALLIFTGIHNAWDVVTYIAVDFDPEVEEATPSPVRDASVATDASSGS
jgi:hypothetical protein